jgi:hypothetical protein
MIGLGDISEAEMDYDEMAAEFERAAHVDYASCLELTQSNGWSADVCHAVREAYAGVGLMERDRDNDTIVDGADNCPDDANEDQVDGDDDEAGDVCDNCPTVANEDQADADDDGRGDACEKPGGSPCSAGAECESNHCVTGVCCDGPCGDGVDPCQACVESAGATADGSCTPLSGPVCDDEDRCTAASVCEAGHCVATEQVICDEADPCLVGACDSLSGDCVTSPVPDGSGCPGGHCQMGQCVLGLWMSPGCAGSVTTGHKPLAAAPSAGSRAR